jgi:molecular chaperone HtpG
VKFGSISHGLPVLITRKTSPVEIYLDPNGHSVRLLVDLYDREYGAFGHMTKDFVRTVIFPRVSDLVPSASRQGAEAFLKSIQRSREIFEYETADLESLKALLKDLFAGKVTIQEAAQRSSSVARTYQVIESGATASVREVVPDVIENQQVLRQGAGISLDPLPPIQRLDIETQRKLLTIAHGDAPLMGYRCFLAVSDRVRDDKGDFFLQPHRTSVVWGGQRALFVFEHHSGQFGLYYDIQTPDLVSQGSGGGPFQTCTIVTKNRVFIPVPEAIESSFVPQPGERKRLEVRCDILYIDSQTKH